ncbi:hypothetical protein OE88DRAFT_1326097 [Heliocybe sulcata]|uniref:Uncharacterized protein n=1 Tax=Heliocybe sulcata TaxID=5364 RepID=A0A5C3NAH9_9AGAM|nr:hypothetical protein OE88DRAFT_1326097 [Heliocybe sulcata]
MHGRCVLGRYSMRRIIWRRCFLPNPASRVPYDVRELVFSGAGSELTQASCTAVKKGDCDHCLSVQDSHAGSTECPTRRSAPKLGVDESVGANVCREQRQSLAFPKTLDRRDLYSAPHNWYVPTFDESGRCDPLRCRRMRLFADRYTCAQGIHYLLVL